MKKKHFISIKNKIILALLPIIVVTYGLVCTLTVMRMNTEITANLNTEIDLTSQLIEEEISTSVSWTIGVMDNVKKSIENGTLEVEDIKDYLYTVADAYPDAIPTGIYCGLEDGTYIDKTWTPDDPEWIMKERPWYVEGIKEDEVTFGETYLDGMTGSYIASVYTNLKDKSGNTFGVISADIPIDDIAALTMNRVLFDNGYVYIIDQYSGLTFGNGVEQDKNGQMISDFSDTLSAAIAQDIESESFGTIRECAGVYYNLQKVSGTNFVTVSIVPVSDVSRTVQSIAFQLVVLSVVGFVVLILAIFLLMTGMLRPLSKISAMITRMHGLDMTDKLVIKNHDEFGKIANQLNDLADSLRGTITLCMESTNSLKEKAESNLIGAGSITESSETQKLSMENLASTMNELSTAIENVADGATTLASNVNNVSTSINSVNGKITETSVSAESGIREMMSLKDNIQEVADSSAELQSAIEAVREGLDGINDMVSVIEGIASQTNLLSLNAGIEAARAGDMGKGFAVVATEIRTLADNSQDSVKRIIETIGKMDGLVTAVVEKAQNNIQLITQSDAEVDHVSASFTKIRDNITDIHESSDAIETEIKKVDAIATDMAATTQEQTASIELVLNTCNQLRDNAQEVADRAGDLDQTGKALNTISDSLKGQVDRFRL